MAFSERAKRTALAIVKIFETAKPFGRYDALVVDHAGISFGVSQFTHASGSLYAVLNRAMRLGALFPLVVEEALSDFAAKRNVVARGRQATLKAALVRLGSDPRVQQAQREIAYEMYLTPALKACEGDNFICPLSLAVIYDSITHGSFAKIRDRVRVQRPGNGSMKEIEYEQEWITEYVKRRDHWLENHRIPLLRKTDYRTDFFLAQIARDNWDLDLPLNVHGIRLTEEILFPEGDPDLVAFEPTDEELDAAFDGIETKSATAFDDGTPGPTAVETTDEQPATTLPEPAESLPTPTPVVVPIGDPPDAEPSFFMKITDWKPWATRWASRIWTAVGSFTIPGGGALGFAAISDSANWWIYAIVGVVVLVLLIGLAIVATLIIAGVYMYQNRGIADLKAFQLRALADPNMKNPGLIFESK
jgi:chitosanase